MKDQECPKCGQFLDKPKYHIGRSKCKKESHNFMEGEHLHYICSCDYDFCIPIGGQR